MAFDGLSSRLQMALRRVTGRGSLTEKDIDEMLREVRLSLLEADVNYRVVKEFLANIKVAAPDTECGFVFIWHQRLQLQI